MLQLSPLLGGAGDLVSKVISRVIIGVTPFRVLITLLITYLLSPLPLQVEVLDAMVVASKVCPDPRSAPRLLLLVSLLRVQLLSICVRVASLLSLAVLGLYM